MLGDISIQSQNNRSILSRHTIISLVNLFLVNDITVIVNLKLFINERSVRHIQHNVKTFCTSPWIITQLTHDSHDSSSFVNSSKSSSRLPATSMSSESALVSSWSLVLAFLYSLMLVWSPCLQCLNCKMPTRYTIHPVWTVSQIIIIKIIYLN